MNNVLISSRDMENLIQGLELLSDKAPERFSGEGSGLYYDLLKIQRKAREGAKALGHSIEDTAFDLSVMPF